MANKQTDEIVVKGKKRGTEKLNHFSNKFMKSIVIIIS